MTVTAGTAPAFSAQGTAHATAAPATAQMIDGQVTLSVDSLAPEIITSGQDLNISGTIANGTDEPLKGLSLTARVQDSTELTVTGLESWLASERDSATRAIDLGVLDSSIAPGAVQTFSLTVAADDLSLGQEDQWGPRGMEVTASQGRNAVAQDRTLLVWDTGEKAARSRVTALIPVTASAEDLTLLTTGAEPPTDAQLADLRTRITPLPAPPADGVVLVSPVFQASYSGLFKSAMDVLPKGTLNGAPVLLGATAGTARHSLVTETALRPLAVYMKALPTTTAVFAASEDFGAAWKTDLADPSKASTDLPEASLGERIAQAGRELAAFIERFPRSAPVDPLADFTPMSALLGGASSE